MPPPTSASRPGIKLRLTTDRTFAAARLSRLLRWVSGSRSPGMTPAAAWSAPGFSCNQDLSSSATTLTPSARGERHPRCRTGDQHSKLENGLQIVVIPDHRTPVVTHMVWYQNGSADDPPGKSGIAHFLEHLMFKGTKAHPKGFSDLVAELGGQENAFTAYDYTAYFQRVAKEHLAP